MEQLKIYTFENIRDERIKIIIEARNFTEAMDLLLSITRDIDDFKTISKWKFKTKKQY